jgi:predicted O-methyltransferase YrrM
MTEPEPPVLDERTPHTASSAPSCAAFGQASLAIDRRSLAQSSARERLEAVKRLLEELAAEEDAGEGRSAGIRQAVELSLSGALGGLPGFSRVFNRFAQQRFPERILLYALVYALRPRTAIEIGTSEGGSALIICGAMDDLGAGRLVCVDQQFRIDDETWPLLYHRATRVEGQTPQVLTSAARAAGELFDFAFVDGDHSFEGLTADLEGLLPLMADGAVLLLHDSHHAPVRSAIDQALARHPNLHDGGELSAEQTVVHVPTWGAKVFGGLRLLHVETPAGRARRAAHAQQESNVSERAEQHHLREVSALQERQIEELKKANDWLNRHVESLDHVVAEQRATIEELRGWNTQLEQAKQWLEEQRASWERIAREAHQRLEERGGG